ncbi:unnamed protein product [Clonostachys byssicola]|uniref:F-box domain-containing protein n=1 Tax=Clonostachys byssicola TaxID=160290 RepID=A0A9N9U0E4_9HYPO|nr:unnamed protein product [Clonostachys byssicola]
MAGSDGIEHRVSCFEKLPTETIWMIASLCDHWDIVALASTSSHMRSKVIPLIHKKVRIVAQQDSPNEQLADFLGRQPPINSRISSTISKGGPPHRYDRHARDDGADGLAQQLFEALQSMPKLRSLSLHLTCMSDSQEPELYRRMLVAGATEIQYLRICASTRVTRRLLQTCPALTTLDFCHGFELGQLHEIPPTVKRLAVTLYVESHLSSSVRIPSLKVENIRHIVRLNSGLEELILRDLEKNKTPFDPRSIETGGLDALFPTLTHANCLLIQKDALRKAAHELSRLLKLQRLTINIWRGTSLQVRSHSQLVPLEKEDWHRNWYSDCIWNLGEALPHVQKICIISGHQTYWQGSRQMPEGTLLTEKRTTGLEKKFPRTFKR